MLCRRDLNYHPLLLKPSDGAKIKQESYTYIADFQIIKNLRPRNTRNSRIKIIYGIR